MAGRPMMQFHGWRDKIWDLLDKMTKQQLAEKLGVTVRTVDRWITPWRAVKANGSKERNYRDMNEAHKKRLRRLWYYHVHGY